MPWRLNARTYGGKKKKETQRGGMSDVSPGEMMLLAPSALLFVILTPSAAAITQFSSLSISIQPTHVLFFQKKNLPVFRGRAE